MPPDNIDDEWAAALEEQRSAEQPQQESGEAEDDFSDLPLEDREESTLLQDDDGDIDWAAALDEQKAQAEEPAPSTAAPSRQPEHNTESMDLLLKIPLEISVQLGDTHMLVNDLIQLGQGSIIELSKNATSEMELYINGKLLGRGEVVVINEHFGIRVAKIIPPEQRIKSLR